VGLLSLLQVGGRGVLSCGADSRDFLLMALCMRDQTRLGKNESAFLRRTYQAPLIRSEDILLSVLGLWCTNFALRISL